MKERLVRANNAPFMNKTLSKTVMHRSRLKNPNNEEYKKHRNYCVNLFKQEKNVAELMNDFFSKAVEQLEIEGL